MRSDPIVPPVERLVPSTALDVAQAEAWASGVVAASENLEAAIDALAASGIERALDVLLGLSVVAPPPADRSAARAAQRLIDAGATGPAWHDVVGTARPTTAHEVADGARTSVVVGFEHADGTRHTVLLECDEHGVCAIALGASDLMEMVAEDAQESGLAVRPIRFDEVAASVGPPDRRVMVDGPTWLNTAVARDRLERLGITALPAFVPPPDSWPGAEPDPEAAALVADLLARTVPDLALPSPGTDDHRRVTRAAVRVHPPTVDGVEPAEADAVATLEWTDWFGAIVGLVRQGPGAAVAGATMVALVNRCPEITTAIPARDAPTIAAGFDVAVEPWSDPELGFVVDGRLSDAGHRLLPAVLLVAVDRERAEAGSSR